MSPWLLLGLGYLLGAVPSSYIAGRATHGIDLRDHGSGNLGASNTFRVLGAKIAAPVMAFDVFKGWFPAWFFPLWDGSARWEWALGYGAAAIVGHVFPVYMRFRGGKGVATATGVFLALAPTALGTALLVWAGVLAMFRMVSLASLSAALTLVVMLLVVETRPPVIWLGVAIAAFVFFAHRSNIRRIVRGEEYRFGQKKPEREMSKLETAAREEEAP
jgi:acyl phosphate:glycerol-3-phosphate acyltransferase